MASPKTILFILIDGIADVNSAGYGGVTALQAVDTPAMDAIAAGGLNGLLDPVQSGLACGSDVAHMTMLGYDPDHCFSGRGAMEVMGAGMDLRKGGIGCKSVFSYMDNSGSEIVAKRCVDRDFEHWGQPLATALDRLKLPNFPEIELRVKYTLDHRCGVTIHGPGLSADITGTDPLKDGKALKKSRPLSSSSSSVYTSKVMNEASDVMRDTLGKHPINLERARSNQPVANVVLLRGPSMKIEVEPFESLHGLRSFMIAPTAIIQGLGMSLGFDIIEAPGATGTYDSDLNSKAYSSIRAFRSSREGARPYHFGFLHVKSVDEAGHLGEEHMKLKCMKDVDNMVRICIEECHAEAERTGQEFVLVLTGDHTTIASQKEHSYEPVPFAICDATHAYKSLTRKPVAPPACDGAGRIRVDDVTKFDEIAASRGCLGRFRGTEVMSLVKAFSGYQQC